MKSLSQRIADLEAKHGIDSGLIEQVIIAIEELGENPNEVFKRLIERVNYRARELGHEQPSQKN